MIRIALLLLIVLFQVTTLIAVYERHVSITSLCAWLLSLIVAGVLFNKPSPKKWLSVDRKEIFILSVLSLLQLGLLWDLNSIPSHYHQDEFITAFTSWSLPGLASIDWFSAYPDVWVSQFPILFHILQKPFFYVFGPTVEAIRISVWPYAIGNIIYLYFLTKVLYSKRLAIIAASVYMVFAPHVYLSSMGLHFISSTFFFIASVTHFSYFIKSRQHIHAILSGIFIGLSYLTYTSSYVSFPVIALFALIFWMMTRERAIIAGFLIATTMMILVLSPFLVYAGTVNNFFTQRVGQVNALWGSWSDPAKQNTLATTIVATQTRRAIESLVVPNIGGMGGYNFGKLALLDPLTALLLTIGFLIVALGAIRKQSSEIIILIALFIPFIAGFILTTHPPPFHRLSVIYPFLALLVGVAIAKLPHRYMIAIVIVLCVVLNTLHARRMTTEDQAIYPQNSRVIGEYILENVPVGQPILIAAYPSFYLGQELLFRTNNRFDIQTEDAQEALQKYNGETLLLLNPTQETIEGLKRAYPQNTLIQSIDGVGLGDITFFGRSKAE